MKAEVKIVKRLPPVALIILSFLLFGLHNVSPTLAHPSGGNSHEAVIDTWHYDVDWVEDLPVGDLGPFLGEASAPIDDATFEDYLVYEHYGGNWSDAEKTADNTDDDLMCWAAVASNVLEWTGWGFVNAPEGDLTNCDEMFAHYQAHWKDIAGWPDIAWIWWFNATGDESLEWRVDVPGGGDFWTPPYNFSDFYHAESGPDTLQHIDEYLSSGCGVVLGIYNSGYAHVVTCWGFRYDSSVNKTTNPHEYYKGVYVTNSDDNRNFTGPAREAPNTLYYVDVSWNSSLDRWNYGGGGLNIRYVWGLERFPDVPIDIKPGGDPNSINPRGKGLVSVAILNDASWTPYYIDPALVDPSSVVFGPNDASPVKWFYEDVDLDGDIDLILFFNVQQTGIEKGDTSAILTANLIDGRQITGFDYIWTAPRKKI